MPVRIHVAPCHGPRKGTVGGDSASGDPHKGASPIIHVEIVGTVGTNTICLFSVVGDDQVQMPVVIEVTCTQQQSRTAGIHGTGERG